MANLGSSKILGDLFVTGDLKASSQFMSFVPTGTVPFIVTSTTLVPNLNVDLLDGQHGAYYLDWVNTTNKPNPTITLSGDASGAVTLTELNDGTLTVAVKDDSHNHIIGNVDGLQTALDGKVNNSRVLTDVPAEAIFTDTIYTHPSSHPATIITEDTTHRFATDTEKSYWNAKASTSIATTTTNGLMSNSDFTKLANIADNANNYIHPANHSIDIITDSASYVRMTPAERATLGALTTDYYTKVNLQTSGAATIHWDNLINVPTYDNYVKWILKANSEGTGYNVTSSSVVDIKGSGATSITRSNGIITISSTNTTYTAGNGLNLATGAFSVKLGATPGLAVNTNGLVNADKGSSQIMFKTINASVGSAVATTNQDALSIVGSGTISTSASEKTVTITHTDANHTTFPTLTGNNTLTGDLVLQTSTAPAAIATRVAKTFVAGVLSLNTSVDALTEVLYKASTGTDTWIRDTDYAINYRTGEITKIDGSSMSSTATVYITYVPTKFVFKVKGSSADNTDYLQIDNRGNIYGKSMTVNLTSSQSSTSNDVQGNFVIQGNLSVNGQTILGNENTDLTRINGSLSLYNGDVEKFTIDSSGIITAGVVPWARLSNIPNASISVKGIVQLSDSTSTTSSVLAATPTAVKAAYDLANSKWAYDASIIQGVKVNNASYADNAGTVNNLTVETAVPQNAIFTDTVYAHPATHNADMIVDGTTNKVYTAIERTKLAGIEVGATADMTATEILAAIKTVDGAGSGLDADTLDGKSSNSYISLEDTVQNTNPFGGRKLYINTLDNALAGADKKYYVTVTIHKKMVDTVSYPKAINSGNITLPQWEDSPIVSTLDGGHLFDNNYESGIVIPSDSYARIRLDFNASGSAYFTGYPYGVYYLSYYNTSTPNNAQVRCYNGYAAHTTGYKTLNFSDYIGTKTSSGYIQQCVDDRNYYRREIEFVVFGHDNYNTTLTEIEWKLRRPSFSSNTPIFTNYGTNKSYQVLNFGTQSSNNITINPDGTISAISFSGSLTGNSSSATKLQAARTISLSGDATGSISFDGTADASITVVVKDNSHSHTSSNISDFAGSTIVSPLTGLVTTTNAVITATDTILSAAGKLQKQISDNLNNLTTHSGNTSNPHSVTKLQVGLGNIQNYGIATQAESEAGTIDTAYMTPLKAKQAIAALQAVKSVAGKTGIVTLTASDVGALSSTHDASTVTSAKITNWDAAYAHSTSSHLTLGETSSAAYRGDYGKIAYDHSQSAHYSGWALYVAGVSKDTVASAEKVDFVASTGLSVAHSVSTGNIITFTNTDRGSSQSIFKNMSDGTNIAVADSNNDTFTFAQGGGLTVLVDATNDKVMYSHADTSSQASVNNSGRTYIQDITLDEYGHITGLVSATESVVDTNTTYSVKASIQTGGASIDLDAGGSGSGTDMVTLLGAGATTVSHTDENTITITSPIHPTQTAIAVDNTGVTVLQDISVNTLGHVTSVGSATITLAGLGYTGATNANYYTHPNHSGDVTSAGDGATTIATNAVTSAKFRQSSALSVVGNGTNATANVADLVAGVDGYVLRRNGATLGFGTIATAGIADDAVTFAKMQDVATSTILGRKTALTGNIESLTAADVRSMLNVADGANNYSHPTQTAVSLNSSLTGATVLSNITVTGNTAGHLTGASVTTRTLTLSDLGYTGATNANYYAHPNDGGGSISAALTGANVIASLIVNAAGHVTGTTTRALTLANLGYTGATNANYYTHPNHSGDITSTGDGATVITSKAVTYSKIQDVSTTNRILGRVTTGAGSMEELTAANVRTIITDASNRFVTDTQISDWNTAKTHAGSTHAPSDAPSNATFTGHTNDSVKHITATERNTWNAKSTLALGETSATAYRGDRGKIAYDHTSSDGSSHTYINQDVKTTASPAFNKITSNTEVVIGGAILSYNSTSKSLDFNFV